MLFISVNILLQGRPGMGKGIVYINKVYFCPVICPIQHPSEPVPEPGIQHTVQPKPN